MEDNEYIVLKNPRYRYILGIEEIKEEIDEEKFNIFLNEFKSFFKEVEIKLYELTKINIDNYIFQIPTPINEEYVKFFKYYFEKLSYNGLLLLDYRNNSVYDERELFYNYWSIKLIWNIEDTEEKYKDLNYPYFYISYIGEYVISNDDPNIQDIDIVAELQKP